MLLNVNRQPEALIELYSDSPISVPPPPIVNVITLLVINMSQYIYPWLYVDHFLTPSVKPWIHRTFLQVSESALQALERLFGTLLRNKTVCNSRFCHSIWIQSFVHFWSHKPSTANSHAWERSCSCNKSHLQQSVLCTNRQLSIGLEWFHYTGKGPALLNLNFIKPSEN